MNFEESGECISVYSFPYEITHDCSSMIIPYCVGFMTNIIVLAIFYQQNEIVKYLQYFLIHRLISIKQLLCGCNNVIEELIFIFFL